MNLLPPSTTNHEIKSTKATKATNIEDEVEMETVSSVETVDAVREKSSGAAQTRLSPQDKPLLGNATN